MHILERTEHIDRMMNNEQYKEDYKKYLSPCLRGKPCIKLSSTTCDKIATLSKEIIKAKVSESHHRCDNHQEFKRFYTGLLGEAALEKLFHTEIVDYNVGPSSYFNVADLSKQGLNIGIKTSEKWNFPVIHKYVKRPEIINVKKDDNTIICLGLATVEVLQQYQSDDYILSPYLKARGTKTCFYGFDKLITIRNLDELRKWSSV